MKLLITGILASLIPVISFEAAQIVKHYGADSRQAIYAGAIASGIYTIYKYLRPSPVNNTDHDMSAKETFQTAIGKDDAGSKSIRNVETPEQAD